MDQIKLKWVNTGSTSFRIKKRIIEIGLKLSYLSCTYLIQIEDLYGFFIDDIVITVLNTKRTTR